jgi:hypothetical protein
MKKPQQGMYLLDCGFTFSLALLFRTHCPDRLSPIAVAAAAEMALERIEMETPSTVRILHVERDRPIDAQVNGIKFAIPIVTCCWQEEAVAVRGSKAPSIHAILGCPYAGRVMEHLWE